MNNNSNVGSNLAVEVYNFEGKEVLLTSSLDVARLIGKEHKNLLRDIRNYIESLTNNDHFSSEAGKFFIESSYLDGNNQERQCFLITQKGLKYIIDSSQKRNKLKPLISLYNKTFKADKIEVVLIDRLEQQFMNDLVIVLDASKISYIIQMPILSYKIDMYLPDYKLSIEYDEKHHYTPSNINDDQERQYEIERVLNCRFLRLDSRNTNLHNIGLVLKELLNNSL